MSAAAIWFFVALVTFSVIGTIFGCSLPEKYRTRSCQGRQWRRAFPDVPKNEIREFLILFVEGFAFHEKDKLKFEPTDQLLEIYQALYPSKWQADALEFETLGSLLEKRYSIDLSNSWKDDMTLGELFVLTRRK